MYYYLFVSTVDMIKYKKSTPGQIEGQETFSLAYFLQHGPFYLKTVSLIHLLHDFFEILRKQTV